MADHVLLPHLAFILPALDGQTYYLPNVVDSDHFIRDRLGVTSIPTISSFQNPSHLCQTLSSYKVDFELIRKLAVKCLICLLFS